MEPLGKVGYSRKCTIFLFCKCHLKSVKKNHSHMWRFHFQLKEKNEIFSQKANASIFHFLSQCWIMLFCSWWDNHDWNHGNISPYCRIGLSYFWWIFSSNTISEMSSDSTISEDNLPYCTTLRARKFFFMSNINLSSCNYVDFISWR